eukprot:Opistho-2@21359
MATLSVGDCKEDSPVFRHRLAEYDGLVDDLERRLKQLVSHAKKRCEFEEKERHMALELAKSFAHFTDSQLADESDAVLADTMHKFASAFQQLEDHREMLISQTKSSFIEPLESFIREEVKEHRDATRAYERACSEYDNATERFAGCRSNDFQSLLDTSIVLGDSKRNYHRTSCDYVIRTNHFHSRKKFLLAERVMDYTTSQLSFFRLGNSIFTEVEGRMGDLFENITFQRKSLEEHTKTEKEQGRDSLAEVEEMKSKMQLHFQARAVQMPVIKANQPPPQVPAPDADGVVKKGHLFVGTKSPFGMSWLRYYHTLTVDGRLSMQRRFKGQVHTEWVPLRISTVKIGAEVDRNFVFQIISPSRTLLLQADSQEEVDVWVISLQQAIATALNTHTDENMHKASSSTAPPHGKHGYLHRKVTPKVESAPGAVVHDAADDGSGNQVPLPADGVDAGGSGNAAPTVPPLELVRGSAAGNRNCADCGSDADWASINIGCTLCLECSGVHRSLGVHISQVRSLTLDRWRPEWIQQMQSHGNVLVNETYERSLADGAKPNAQSDRKTRETFIRQKYVDLAFMSDEDREKIVLERQRVQAEAQEAANKAAEKAAADAAAAKAHMEAARAAEAEAAAQRAAEGGLPHVPSPSAQAMSSWFSFGEGMRARNASRNGEDPPSGDGQPTNGTLASTSMSTSSGMGGAASGHGFHAGQPGDGTGRTGIFSRVTKSIGNTYRSVVDFAKNEGMEGSGSQQLLVDVPAPPPPVVSSSDSSLLHFGRRK